ncbi:MFS general substrate transporter [Pluteus cervinus]|uniref:MFS general substrate transporter n=1 Tax=Pluteus cervinus TaxID=181527 RepID=A0ACD3AE16_9AGAR|nr:MFS general substrate transporter [Pluteus cervinus]
MSAFHSKENASNSDMEDGKAIGKEFGGRTCAGRSSKSDSAYNGVKKLEGAYQGFGVSSTCLLFAALLISVYLYSLDNTTSAVWIPYGLFTTHVSVRSRTVLNVVNVLPLLIPAAQPLFAKIADVESRGWAFASARHILAAAAQNFSTLAAGRIINLFGFTGLRLLSRVLIADMTTLKWRGLASAAVSSIVFPNYFVFDIIARSILVKSGWRWGYGMFTIVVPAVVTPLLFILFVGERRAKTIGHLISSPHSSTPSPKSFLASFFETLQQFDIIGLLLLFVSITLILFPFNLPVTADNNILLTDNFWTDQSSTASLICGLLLLPVFGIWEWAAAKYPVVPKSVSVNWVVIVATLVLFLDFFSFSVSFYYIEAVLPFQKPWTYHQFNNFGEIHNVAIPVFGLLAGIGMRVFRRYKPFLILGLALRTIGVGMMIHSHGAGDGSDQEVVASQILQGIGSGFASIAALVGAQASVPHINVAMVTAIVLLASQAGSVMGAGIANAIWLNILPGKLVKYLPGFSGEELEQFLQIQTFRYPLNPLRQAAPGALKAYDEVLRTMATVATCLSLFAFVLSLTMHGAYLGDTQNAVDGRGLDGELVEESEIEREERVVGQGRKRRRSLMVENRTVNNAVQAWSLHFRRRSSGLLESTEGSRNSLVLLSTVRSQHLEFSGVIWFNSMTMNNRPKAFIYPKMTETTLHSKEVASKSDIGDGEGSEWPSQVGVSPQSRNYGVNEYQALIRCPAFTLEIHKTRLMDEDS